MSSSHSRTDLKTWALSTALAVATLALLADSALPIASAQQEPRCTILGSAARDVLRGTAADERLCGLGGDDVVLGRAGDDTLVGGAGDDLLYGGRGEDTLLGETGDDLLVDRAGDGVLDGGPGRDRCVGRRSTTFRGCEVVLRQGRPVVVSPAVALPRVRPLRTPAPTPAAQPAFDAAKSAVEPRGDALVVTFEETGLAAGAPVDIEVSATRTTTVTCVDPQDSDRVVLRTSSSAEATETTTYRADARGRVAGSRTLHAAPGRVEITGYVCRTTEQIVVTLRDLTNGATLTLSP